MLLDFHRIYFFLAFAAQTTYLKANDRSEKIRSDQTVRFARNASAPHGSGHN